MERNDPMDPADRQWLEEKAAAEDGCEVGVGGGVPEDPLGMIIWQPLKGLVFYGEAMNGPIVTIRFDGTIELNPKYEVVEAARVFWEAVRRLAPVK